jgi:DNA-binding transcriptional regulator YhcF (GntR family)
MAIRTREIAIKEKANIPKIKKAIKKLQTGSIDDTVNSIGFLVKELTKQPISPDVQDLTKQLVSRLLSECHSMCESTRRKAIEELGKLIKELTKIKDLEGLRYIAKASRKRRIRRKA